MTAADELAAFLGCEPSEAILRGNAHAVYPLE
jgi:hypothetical protein